MVLYSPQIRSITGPNRRKVNNFYRDDIQNRFGLAAQEVSADMNAAVQDNIRADESAMRERELAMTQQANAEEASQAKFSSGISTIGLGLQAKKPIMKGGKSLISAGKGLFGGGKSGSVASLGAESGAPLSAGASEALFAEGASSVAGLGAESGTVGMSTAAGSTAQGSGIGSMMKGAGPVLAIMAAQNMLTGTNKRTFEGQPARDLFTWEDGSPRPGFATEPWRAAAGSWWGLPTTPGEEWDAAFTASEWDKVLQRTPAMAEHWVDPIGGFASDAMRGAGEKWGLEGAAEVGAMAFNPAATISRAVGGTWICMEINKYKELTMMQKLALQVFRNYCIIMYPDKTKHYLEEAPKLIGNINKSIDDMEKFWLSLKVIFVDKIIELLVEDKFEEAVKIYEKFYIELVEEYMPELDISVFKE